MAREPWSGLPQVNGAERLTSRVADLLARDLFEKRQKLVRLRLEREGHEQELVVLDGRIRALEAEILEVESPLLNEPIEFTSLRPG